MNQAEQAHYRYELTQAMAELNETTYQEQAEKIAKTLAKGTISEEQYWRQIETVIFVTRR